MAERTVLLDATQAVIEAHTDLIANGTVAVASLGSFKNFMAICAVLEADGE